MTSKPSLVLRTWGPEPTPLLGEDAVVFGCTADASCAGAYPVFAGRPVGCDAPGTCACWTAAVAIVVVLRERSPGRQMIKRAWPVMDYVSRLYVSVDLIIRVNG